MTSKPLHSCQICDKLIHCHTESIGRGGRRLGKNGNIKMPMFTRLVSDDGVFFRNGNKGGVWFCNECWSLILKGVTELPKDI